MPLPNVATPSGGRTSTGANPIAEPALDAAGILTFKNLAVDTDVARMPRGYRAAWSTFDNTTHEAKLIGETSAATPQIQAPAGLPRYEGAFVKVELSALGSAYAAWAKPASAYFRLDRSGWNLVGFERMAE